MMVVVCNQVKYVSAALGRGNCHASPACDDGDDSDDGDDGDVSVDVSVVVWCWLPHVCW